MLFLVADTPGKKFRAWTPFAVIGASYVFLLLLLVGTAFNPSAPPAGRVAGGVGAAVCSVFLVFAWRAGVMVGAEGVVVRMYRGRIVPVAWDCVARFVLTSAGRGGAYIAVETKDGTLLKTQGLASNSMESVWGRKVAREMEACRPTG